MGTTDERIDVLLKGLEAKYDIWRPCSVNMKGPSVSWLTPYGYGTKVGG
jgi:hypothetical protein